MKAKTAEVPEYLRDKINDDQADDAFLLYAQLRGDKNPDWTVPEIPIQLDPMKVGSLRDALNGLSAVVRLIRMQEDSVDTLYSGYFRCGLVSAAVALADFASKELEHGVDYWEWRIKETES